MSVQSSRVMTRKSESREMPRLRQCSGVVVVEELVADDRVDVGDDADEHHDVEHAGDGAHHRGHDEAQLGEGRDEPQDPRQPREAGDDGEGSDGGNEGEDDDGEVEEVPAVAEIAVDLRGDGEDLQGRLGDEDPENQALAEVEPIAGVVEEAR